MNTVFPIMLNTKCSANNDKCGFFTRGTLDSLSSSNDIIIYGYIGPYTQYSMDSKLFNLGFVSKVNKAGVIEFMSEIKVSTDKNDEVTSCSTQGVSNLYCYVET